MSRWNGNDASKSVFHPTYQITSKIVPILIFLLVTLHDKRCFAYDTSSLASCNEDSTVTWSTPEECLRPCSEDEAPLYCYYHFTLEYYTTMNDACTLCLPNNTNQLSNIGECQCVQADGFERTILSINRMIPGPSIQVCKNDMVIIDVVNKIEGIGVSLHWHGILQNNYQYYDGVPFLTQCPIQGHDTFRYQYRVKNAGTHFYHSHVAVHKIDGQYGSLIVRQPPNIDPQKKFYDEDLPTHVLLLSDWMHELSMERFPGLLRRLQGQAAENILINGKGTWRNPDTNETTKTGIEILDVEPGKRYRIRMINAFSTVCLTQLNIEDHRLSIIAQDGEDVEPATVDTILTGSGERVDFVLTADQPANRSYWIQVRGLGECESKMVQQLAVLRYTESPSTLPPTESPTYWEGIRQGTLYNPLDALCDEENSLCVDKLKRIEDDDQDLLRVEADHQFIIPIKFYNYSINLDTFFKPGNYKNFLTAPDRSLLVSVLNDIIYVEPPKPLISQPYGKNRKCNASTTSLDDTNQPSECVHTLDVEKGSLVEIIVYDQELQPFLAHPFHLHGYAFRLFEIGSFQDNRNVTRADMDPVIKAHRQRLIEGSYSRMPAKDTVIVPQGGWVILRFKADNPGWWLFHCHFIWHTIIGMDFVVHVGEQSDLPPVPPGFPRCGDFTPPVCSHE